MLWPLLRPLVFSLEAEKAHHAALACLRLARLGPSMLCHRPQDKHLAFGTTFRNRVGLAAGFDKNAKILSALPKLGFGFAEIGTVTPRPQTGNPKPRMFRDTEARSLFNRLGFNNDGAEVVARRLEKQIHDLPENFRVGVNIGKNKDTPLEMAAKDYRLALACFKDLADYVVVNVSSPNTPGLRRLQNADDIAKIFEECSQEVKFWRKVPPLLLKLQPEHNDGELENLIRDAEGIGFQGFVLTNTMAGQFKEFSGGWSGEKITDLSRSALQRAKKVATTSLISVGGICNSQEAKERIGSGAELIQIYSALVFNGPFFPSKLVKEIRL